MDPRRRRANAGRRFLWEGLVQGLDDYAKRGRESQILLTLAMRQRKQAPCGGLRARGCPNAIPQLAAPNRRERYSIPHNGRLCSSTVSEHHSIECLYPKGGYTT